MTAPATPPKGLTRPQMDCLRVICELTAEAGICPSYQEIRNAMGLASQSGVSAHVTNLAKKGWISRDPYAARSIVVIHQPPHIEVEEPTFILADHIAPPELLAQLPKRGPSFVWEPA